MQDLFHFPKQIYDIDISHDKFMMSEQNIIATHDIIEGRFDVVMAPLSKCLWINLRLKNVKNDYGVN